MRTLQDRLKDREFWIANALDAGEIETPCLVVDTRTMDQLLSLWRDHLPQVGLFYSVKANNDRHILRHLQQSEIGFDAASESEVETLLALGVKPDRIILSNTIKTRGCLQAIVRNRIPLVTADNERDLRAIAQASVGEWSPSVLIRLKVSPTDVQIDLNEKFGCTVDEARRLIEVADSLGLKPAGVHFHVGSQCWNLKSYRDAMESAVQLLDEENRAHLKIINIGGGFPDALTASKCGGLSCFFEGLAAIAGEALSKGYSVIAEPGRVLVADACTAVCQVIGRATHDGHEWLYLDDGIYGLFSTAYFEKQPFEFVPVRESDASPCSFVVAGPTCDSLDVVGKATLPSDTQPTAYVMAHRAGAYSVSVKSHFNGFGNIRTYVAAPPPATLASNPGGNTVEFVPGDALS
ncbi:MAG: hypothetical protein KIS66_06295 [Fimbriimonadaceae bacterium]|nr:hypothetical protein [Fimbriimonadaceae bacterium]